MTCFAKTAIKTTFLFISLLFLLISCNVDKLNKEYKEWQPYQKDDILIFKSNKDEVDTVWIKEIKRRMAVDDHLSFFPNRFQVLDVSGEITVQKPYPLQNKKPIKKSFIHLFTIYANNPDNITYKFSKRLDTLWYSHGTKLTFSELNELNKNSPKFKFKSFEIKVDDTWTGSKDVFLNKYFWSKKYGYTAYEFNNGYRWELQQFIRNGKNILME